MMPLLDEYDVKATFFIDNYDHLDEDQIDFLLELQSAGHEIGAHGMSHQDYGIHLENGGTDMTYWLEEVEPGVRMMENDGFIITSFAYPRGVKSPSIDTLLLENFTALRGLMASLNRQSLGLLNAAIGLFTMLIRLHKMLIIIGK